MKKHIVFVWELGSGYGHISGMKLLIQSLIKKNYKISLISANLSTAHLFLKNDNIDLYQAPAWASKSSYLKNTLSFAEILISLGYCENDLLKSMVNSWFNLLKHLKADLIIADHSPTALIASRLLNLNICTIGIGFFIPPKSTPLPSFLPLNNEQNKQLIHSEQRVLIAINKVLNNYKHKKFKQLYDLFYPATHFFCTFEELDHFNNRGQAHFVGSFFDEHSGIIPKWPKNSTQKIFAYLKEDNKGFKECLKALTQIKASVVLHIPHAKNETLEYYKRYEHIKIYTQPVLMKTVYKQSDLIICHGGHAVISASLLHGKRLLLIPHQLEQMLLTTRLTQQQLAMAINPNYNNQNYVQSINNALNHPAFGKAAIAFKERFKAFSQSKQTSTLAEKIERLIKT